MMLTAKMSQFIASYKLTGNSTEAAINAGYSVKTAPQAGCRLLKHPKVVTEIEQWRIKKSEALTKTDFIDMALADYRSVDVTEPNRPRYLDLAAKVAGHIGANNDQKPTTINNLTQININSIESQSEAWELTRKLIGND